MSMSLNQLHPLENYTSGLRYGLIEVEPFEEEKIVKRFGVKFRERRWGLKPSESFEDFVRFNTEAVIGSIAVPSHLDRTRLVELLAEKRIQNFESDTELKKALEQAQRATKAGVGLKRMVEFFVNRQRSRIDDVFDAYASLFLASDLPLSFVSDFTEFEVTYVASLEAILSIVRPASTLMNLPEARSDFRKYQRVFNRMKLALSPMVEQIESAAFRAQALKWYMILSNAESTETALEPKSIQKSKMNPAELETLRWDFKQDSAMLRKLVIEHDKEDRMFQPLVNEVELKSYFDEVVMALAS